MYKPDERFIIHRSASTRIAMIVGPMAITGWFGYELVANQHSCWDLAIIAGVMAATKILAMAYFRLTH
jgi:hypothetical protein